MIDPRIANAAQEALAVIGVGLFAFGVHLIYPPACYIFSGLVLCVPFTMSVIGGNK
jgi:hypothetical protein